MIHCKTPCPVCPNSARPDFIVGTDGPSHATSLWIGEGPGYWEFRSRDKIPFVGKAGRELDRLLLPFAGLSRSQILLANAVSCFFDGDNQTPAQALACAPVNLEPIVRSMPNLRHVVFMGATSCSILGWAATDYETGAPIKVPNLMLEHGLPVNRGRPISLFGRKVHAIALLHPAIVLHQGAAMGEVIEDFRSVKLWRETGWTGPQDEVGEDVIYEELRDGDAEARDLWRRRLRGRVVALDTENDSRGRPWCAQLSARMGQGCMVRVGQPESLALLQEAVDRAELVLISFAKHDLPVVAEMGLVVPEHKIVDTVLLARQLFVGSASIKALARRLAGMEMDSWEEITWVQFEEDCIEWLLEAESLVGTEVLRQERGAHALLRELADGAVPADAKNRKACVNREFKQLLWQLEEERGDTWRPPVEYYDRGGKPTRRRAAGFEKQIGRILGDHQRSKDNRNQGVDFRTRWFGEANDEDSIGTLDRMPVWVTKILRRELGEFPRRGLDQAPYERALHYACRDVDSLVRVWPYMERRAKEVGNQSWS